MSVHLRVRSFFTATYSGITDYYASFDIHISFFYDTQREKIYIRTFYYASGMLTYEELKNSYAVVNESDEPRTVAGMLLRTGFYLSNDI